MAETTNKLELPLADVPFDEMIASMGTGIAEAQRRLDEISFEITKMMSGTDPKHRIKLGAGDNAPTYSLLDLGFTPTFYQFVDTTLEIKVAFSMNSATTSTTGKDQQKTVTTKSTPVDATYANRFQYPVEGFERAADQARHRAAAGAAGEPRARAPAERLAGRGEPRRADFQTGTAPGVTEDGSHGPAVSAATGGDSV